MEFTSFCIATSDEEFDFHFTSEKKVGKDECQVQSFHHRMPFRYDLVDYMKRCDQAPHTTLEQNIKLREEYAKLSKKSCSIQ